MAEDAYEREADAVSSQVMRMSDAALSQMEAPVEIRRKCAACEKEDDENKLRRTSAGAAGPIDEAPEIVQDVLRSPGEPLDAATRSFMEPRFGRDFGSVRLHRGTKASLSTIAVNAQAYAFGSHIVVGGASFDSQSQAGRALLAHELAHVLQQEGGLGAAPRGPASTRVDSAARASIAANATTQLSSSGPSIARLAGPPVAVTPQQIAQMRQIFQQVNALMQEGAIASQEAAEISTAVGEAEAAIATAGEVAAAGTTAAAAGDAAVIAAAGLAADDVTGLGVADDVAIPFVLLAAAVAFGVGYVLGSSAAEIEAAWRHAAEAVRRAVEAMQRAISHRLKSKRANRTQPSPQPRPVPHPNRDTDEEDKPRFCRSMAVGQRGGNSCHDAFATTVSGSPREWGVETPEAQYAEFDALGGDNVLYEIKTGYRYLLNTSGATQQWREATIHRFVEQSEHQLHVANRCGYALVWVFNDRRVADLVEGFIQPPVTYRPFDCTEDRRQRPQRTSSKAHHAKSPLAITA